jgi:uncharacterized protein
MVIPAPTPTAAVLAAPARLVPQFQRINSVDVIRGVALLGILLMNIIGMGMPWEAYEDPTVIGGATGWNLRAWLATTLFFEGTMRALFSMLFGAGVLLFTRKDEEKAGAVSVADLWYRRTIWLFIFGQIHAYVVLWTGDILYAYGLIGMFLFPFRHLAASRLFALGATLLLAGALAYSVSNRTTLDVYHQAMAAQKAQELGETLSKPMSAALADWERISQEHKPSAEALEEVVTVVGGGYFSAWQQRAGVTNFHRSVWHYRHDYFDVLSMMLIGMACLKWGVFQASLTHRAYGLMVVAGYAVGLAVNWREVTLLMAEEFAVVAFYRSHLTYDVGRVAMMTGHIGLIMLVCKLGLLRGLTDRLAAVGRMALTNYVSHSLITTTVFIGFGQYGQWERHQLYYLVAGIWIFQLIASPLWLRYFHFGPLEWLWRRLTYWQPQPFARTERL